MLDDLAGLAAARELHAGIVRLVEGVLLRNEQLAVTRQAVAVSEAEAAAGRDMVNRVLRRNYAFITSLFCAVGGSLLR